MRTHLSYSLLRKSAATRRPRGVATVELAIVLPLLTLLFVLTVDFGRYFHVSTVISQCARNGAIYLAQPDIADSLPYLSLNEATMADAANLKGEAVVSSMSGMDELDLPYVEVRVEYGFKTVTRFPGIAQDWKIVRTARARTVFEE